MAGLVESTRYRVQAEFDARDRGSTATMRSIERAADSAAKSTGRLSSALAGVGAAFVGGRGLGLAKSALIDFNGQVEDTKNQIAGMMALATNTKFADNLERADYLFGRLQERAKSLPGTTAEYTKMAGDITQPVMDAGLRMKDLEDFTVNAVVAAKALGEQADVAARDIGQALRGQLGADDPFMGKLMASIGYVGEGGREKFNKQLTSTKRAEEVKRALMQSQITDLAAAQGATFGGQVSTLKDNFSQLAGKIGLPLFKALTREVRSWNEWLEKNQDKVDRFAQTVADGLVTGFRFMKDAVAFIVEHADTLIDIGKIWIGLKLAGGASGALSGLLKAGSGGKGLAGLAGRGAGLVETGLMAAAAGQVIGATLGTAWTNATDEQTVAFNRLTASTKMLDDVTRAAATRGKASGGARATAGHSNLAGLADFEDKKLQALIRIRDGKYQYANESSGGLFSSVNNWKVGQRRELQNAGFDEKEIELLFGNAAQRDYQIERLQKGVNQKRGRADVVGAAAESSLMTALDMLTAKERESIDQSKALQAVFQLQNQAFQNMANGTASAFLRPEELLEAIRGAVSLDNFKSQKKPGNTNIKIDRVEVAAKDPDRWIAELDARAKKHVKAPRQPRGALRGT